MSSLRKVIILNLLIIVLGLTPLYSRLRFLVRFSLDPVSARLNVFNAVFLQWVNFVKSFPSLQEENESLKKRFLVLEGLEVKLQQSQKENEILKSQLKVKPNRLRPSLLLARVLGRDGEGKIVLNLGKNDGLALGNLATLGGSLLGKIVAVEDFRAKLLLTVSPQSRWPAVTPNFEARGEVEGSFGNQLKLTKVLPSQTLEEGATLIDPESRLILGKVVKVEETGAKIFKEAALKVFYQPEFLSDVFVLLD